MTCGVDMIEVERIRRSIQNEMFLETYFSQAERDYFAVHKNRAEVVAGNFAAKEAFSKALRTGVRGFSMNEVAALRNSLGAPYFSFSGKAAELVVKSGLWFSLSISHTAEHAVAMVVASKENQ